MNLRFVEAYRWAPTLMSVSRTAGKLFVAQSALASHITALPAVLDWSRLELAA